MRNLYNTNACILNYILIYIIYSDNVFPIYIDINNCIYITSFLGHILIIVNNILFILNLIQLTVYELITS